MASEKRLTFNEFQRELTKRNIPVNEAYMLTLVYEAVADISTQTEAMAKIVVELAQSIGQFADLSIQQEHVIQSLKRRLDGNGVSVQSVANDPEKH